jgi:hypothetical protein
MDNSAKEEIEKLLKNMTWLEAIERIWLAQLADLVPNEIHLTIIDLVTTCKGLLETGVAMQELVKKIYNDRIGDVNVTHKIAVDESNGLFTKNEALLLDKLYRNEVFDYFTKPMTESMQ